MTGLRPHLIHFHDAKTTGSSHHRVAPLLAAGALAVAASPAHAGQPVHLALGAGQLSLTPAAATVTGNTLHASVVVRDARGTGQGWKIVLAAPHNLKVAAITATCEQGSTCTLPKALDLVDPTSVHATPGTGMGAIKVAVTFAPLPAGAQVGLVKFGVVPFVA